MRLAALLGTIGLVALALPALGFDYKAEVTTGSITVHSSSMQSFTVSSGASSAGAAGTTLRIGGFDGRMRQLGGNPSAQPLDERIRRAESSLNKLYFIRDVCPKFESPVELSFDELSLPDAFAQLEKTLGAKIPAQLPEGSYTVEKSSVKGMPADQFLETVADLCKLEVTYTKEKVILKPRKEPADKRVGL